jgi:hypothetical protein
MVCFIYNTVVHRHTFVKVYSNFSPKLRPSARTKSILVENNAIFEVFRKALTDRLLYGLLFVNGRFTKYKFAKGIVSLRQRLCFVV